MKNILSMPVFLFLVGCCGAPVTNDGNVSTEKVIGTYQGTLPCADCAGINTELTLNDDQTFSLKETYLKDSKTLATSTTGRWQRRDNVIEFFPTTNGTNTRFCYGISSIKTIVRYDINCAPIQETTLNYSLKKQ